MQGLGFRVQGLGFSGEGLGCRNHVLGFLVLQRAFGQEAPE